MMRQKDEPDGLRGLNAREVKERNDRGQRNIAVVPSSRSTRQIVAENVFTYFNLIFAVLAVLLILVGSFRDLTFLPVIIANTLIGIVQEIRSKKVLDKLTVLNAPKAQVLREGALHTIQSEDLVLDDVVRWEAGNQICADAVVLEGEVQVNESLLTGEADEISKKTGDSLMSGSFIVSGSCYARLEKVGKDSYISQLTLEAKAEKTREQSEMMRSLTKLIKMVGFVIIPIGLIMFLEHHFLMGETIRGSVVSMVAALLGMIPEGLYLLASVALAVSVIRLAQKRVLVHNMSCIETLARVDVLCADKTGTITENTMQVNDLIPLDGREKESLKRTVGDFVRNMDRDNITMEAMQEYFKENSERKALSVTSFSSAYKYSSASFEEGVYVLGAPEFVLQSQYEEYREVIEEYSEQGYRVLVFALYHGVIDGGPLTEHAEALGLILLSNPVRKEAAETFHYFAQQGVEVKVISGDNPMTVSEVAKQAEIPHAEYYIDASKLTSEEMIDEAILKYTVFGRVTPEQKKQFVLSLQKMGKTVAMTGDGVNDVLALKRADCSIAMASGSDAATHAAQLVLLDSDFSCMPSVVAEGRRVVNNIQRSSCLFLVKNIFSFLMALFSMIFLVDYPLMPSQISLVSMFTIGVPAFFLALEPNHSIIKGNFLHNVLFAAFPAGLTNFIAIGAMVVFGKVFEVDSLVISTCSTVLLAVVGLMILFQISKPMNALRWTIWLAMMAGLIFSSFFLSDLFSIYPLSLEGGMLLVVFAIVTEPIFRYITILFEKARQFIQYLKRKFRGMRNSGTN
jgi:HAD ATPase, P-type, family IC